MKVFALSLVALTSSLGASLASDTGKNVGNPTAPITIELYSDFQCPNCKALHEQILPMLMQEFVGPGKVYLVNRDFPLPMHNHSREADGYATAAARIGKYSAVADALFRDQAAWSVTGKVWETVATALTPGEQKEVQGMAKSPAILAEVQKDVDTANANRINQTPTMIVKKGAKTYPVPGLVAYNILKSFLDDRLKEK